jgi:hypothetical protein
VGLLKHVVALPQKALAEEHPSPRSAASNQFLGLRCIGFFSLNFFFLFFFAAPRGIFSATGYGVITASLKSYHPVVPYVMQCAWKLT